MKIKTALYINIVLLLLYKISLSHASIDKELDLKHKEIEKIRSKLKKEELQNINKGVLISKQIKIKNEIWPIVEIFGVIDSEPLDSVALYYALDAQYLYVPNLLKSTPIKQISPTEVHTSYEFDLPWPLGTSSYVNGSTLNKNNDGSYTVRWYQVENDSAEYAKGSATFYFFENKTFLYYKSFMRPKSFLAGMLRDLMVRDILKSLEATKKFILKIQQTDQKFLKKYQTYIIDALDGKNVYLKN